MRNGQPATIPRPIQKPRTNGIAMSASDALK